MQVTQTIPRVLVMAVAALLFGSACLTIDRAGPVGAGDVEADTVADAVPDALGDLEVWPDGEGDTDADADIEADDGGDADDGDADADADTGTVCPPGWACTETPCTLDEECEEDTGCQATACDESGVCRWAPVTGIPCNDGDPCTWEDRCDHGDCEGKAAPCDDEEVADCASNVCDGNGGCDVAIEPEFCLIDGNCAKEGDAGDLAGCNVCDPSVSVDAWTPNPADQPCDDKDLCTQGDVCDGDGSCAGTPYLCAEGGACAVATCTGDGACVYEPEDGTCLIEGWCYAQGDVDPAQPCLACTAESPTAWVTLDDGVGCGIADGCGGAGTCSEGVCVGFDDVCVDAFKCTEDNCDESGGCLNTVASDACLIDGICRTGGAKNPNNACQVCDPTQPNAWSAAPASTDCDDGDACTAGDKCSAGVCVPGPKLPCAAAPACATAKCSTTGTCSYEAKDGWCLHSGACVEEGGTHPVNQCLACTPDQPGNWSPKDGGTTCDDGDPCTFEDVCSGTGFPGACEGIPTEDLYDAMALNESPGSATYLGKIEDKDPWPTDFEELWIYPSFDVDWMAWDIADTPAFGEILRPKAAITVPSGQTLELCIYYACEFPSNLTGLVCADGESAKSESYGMQGCCAQGGGEKVTVTIDPNCVGISETGTAFASVILVDGPYSCEPEYVFEWGDAE